MLQKHIDKLENIKKSLIFLNKDIANSLKYVLEGLKSKDIKNFDASLECIENISKVAKGIDNEILASLALFGAEASDLRGLVAYLKITNEMMRMGENIKSFCKRIVRTLYEDNSFDINQEYIIGLCKTSAQAVDLIDKMLNQTDKDAILSLYQKVTVQESKNDDLYSLLEKNIFTTLSNSNEFSKNYMDILSITRKLERIADRTLDISKLLVFAVDGGEIDVY